MSGEFQGGGGGGKASVPLDKKHVGGRRLKGLSTPGSNRILEPYKSKITKDGIEDKILPEAGKPYRLTSQQLVSMAIELGLPWSDLSQPNPHVANTVLERAPTDAEILYLQFPGQVPLAFYAQVFGSSAPSLFWSDLGAELPTHRTTLSDEDLKHRLEDWWRALHRVRDDASCTETLGEAADLVVHGRSPSDREYEITIPGRSVNAIFTGAPRAVITQPKAEFDPNLGHRIITGFGFADVMYFHAFHLLGRTTWKYHSPDKAAPVSRQ